MHYVFDMDEILALEADVELLHSMCLNAVEHVILTERFADFGLPEWVGADRRILAAQRPARVRSVRPALRRRRPAKLLEYNADTPTTLLEASIVQWHWLKDLTPTTTSGTRCTSGWSSVGRAIRDRLPGPSAFRLVVGGSQR